MEKNKQLFAPVWRHWKNAFNAYRYWVVGTFVFYGIAFYLEDVYKATLWQRIVDALQKHENPLVLFLYVPIGRLLQRAFGVEYTSFFKKLFTASFTCL
jgi:hypothetical protein